MNTVDIKNRIEQKEYKLLERIDGRIIIYLKNDPIYSFENLNKLIIALKERKGILDNLSLEKLREAKEYVKLAIQYEEMK